MSKKKILFTINLIFGSLLLYTYYEGLSSNPNIGMDFWGGVPHTLTSYIIYSMFISALGYFFFTYYLLFKVDENSILIFNKFNYSIFIYIYTFILIPSCMWIDLTVNYIKVPNSFLWLIICLVLYMVGLSSILLLACLYNLKPSKSSLLYKISFIGCIFFTFHTVILDGLLWTILFHK